jgi:SRSO17 transposase
MPDFMNSAAVQRLEGYFESIGKVLDNKAQRASFAVYAMGLFGDGERKSMEPIACRVCPDPERADAAHQRLLHFATDAKWSDHEVRRVAAKYAVDAMTEREPIEVSIVDDTGFPKQGTHSVGVQRQYTGTLGKIANCQIGVSLSVATKTEHVPLDFELYLPTSWTENAKRRREARIPDEVVFKTKLQLALEIIRRAVADGIPLGVLLADAAYGSSAEFRAQVRSLGLHYAVAVDPQTNVQCIDKRANPQGDKISVSDLAWLTQQRSGFRRCTWRKGVKEDLTAKFAVRRVMAVNDAGQAEALWLIIEWRDGESEPANYFLSSLAERKSKKQLIRIAMQRWRTERVYEDLKGELGLDHFEGRRYSGWYHHISVALCCYAFIVAERVRRFPPSTRGSAATDPLAIAA